MGLILNDFDVIVDHSVGDHMHTTKSGNPTEASVDGLLVHSIFKRLKNSSKLSRDRGRKKIGDNCPLVYALKGKQNLKTSITSIKALFDDFPPILEEVCNKFVGEFDAIVAMPSSYPIGDCLAKRLARHTGMPILHEVFRKSTNAEASAAVEARLLSLPKSFSRDEATQLRNSLKKMRKEPEQTYSAKNVGISVRQYFAPLQVQDLPASSNTKLLLVDDLLASGETLLCARNYFIHAGFPRPAHAVTWFSGV